MATSNCVYSNKNKYSYQRANYGVLLLQRTGVNILKNLIKVFSSMIKIAVAACSNVVAVVDDKLVIRMGTVISDREGVFPSYFAY